MAVEQLTFVFDADTSRATAETTAYGAVLDGVAQDRTANLSIEVDRASAAQAEARTAAIGRDRTVSFKPHLDRASAATAEGWLDKFHQKLFESNQGAQGLGRVLSVLKFPAITNAISLAAQGITALAGGATALVAAWSPMVGLIGAAPQGFLALGQAGGVAVLSVKSVTEAMKAEQKAATDASAATQAELVKALRSLGPEATKFVQDSTGLKRQFQILGGTVGEGLFAGINTAMGDLRGKLLPAITPMLVGTSGAMGNVVAGLGKSLTTPQALTDMRTIMAANIPMIESFGRVLENVGAALRNVAISAMPMVRSMMQALEGGSAALARWSQEGRDSGRMAEFFRNAWDTARQFGSTLADLAGALVNVGKAASNLGTGLTDSLADGAKRMREWTSSAQGMAQMQAYFDSLRPALSEMGRLITGLGKVFTDIGANTSLANFIRQINDNLVPVLAEFNRTTSEAFTQALVDAITQVARAFVELASVGGGLSTMLAVIASVAQSFTWLLQHIPGLTQLIGVILTLKAALAGLAAVGALSGLTNVIGALGSQVKFLATDASSLGAKLWYVGASANAAVGPSLMWGAAIGAVTYAIVGYLGWQEKLTKAQQAYRQELAGQIAEPLRDNESAVAQINQRIAALNGVSDAARQAALDLEGFGGLTAPTDLNAHEQYRGQSAAAHDAAVALKENTEAVAREAEAVGVNADAAVRWALAHRDMSAAGLDVAGTVRAMTTEFRNLAAAEALKKMREEFPGLNEAFTTAEQAVTRLETAEQTLKGLQSEQTALLKQRESAMRAVTEATKGQAKAQEALNKALQPASALDLAEASLAVRQAQIEQKKAADELNGSLAQQAALIRTIEMVQDEFSGKTYEVVRITAPDKTQGTAGKYDAEERQIRAEQAAIALARAEERLAELRQKGTEADPAVQAAREALATANQQAADASKNLGDIEQQLADNAGAIAAAVVEADTARQAATDALIGAQAALNKLVSDGHILASQAGAVWAAWSGDLLKNLGENSPVRQQAAATLAILQQLAAMGAGAPGATGGTQIWGPVTRDRAVARGMGTKYREGENGNFIPDGGGDWEVVDLDTVQVNWGTSSGIGLYNAGKKEGRYQGGRVAFGSSYVVGEHGAEVFRPDTSGWVQPKGSTANSVGPTSTGKVQNIEMHFSERVDPMLVARELAWSTT